MILKILRVLNVAIFFALLTLIGTSFIPSIDIDPALKPYYNSFKETVETICPPRSYRTPSIVHIQFDTLQDTTIGYCDTTFNFADIKIDKWFWGLASEDQRYELMMHELTHCFMGKGFLAAFPFHTPDEHHYMFAYIRNLPSLVTKEQLLQVAKERCGK